MPPRGVDICPSQCLNIKSSGGGYVDIGTNDVDLGINGGYIAKPRKVVFVEKGMNSNTRARSLEEGEHTQPHVKKRAMDLMETSPSMEDKGFNSFLRQAE